MPKVTADFSGISSSFEDLDADVPYRFRVIEIQDQSTDPEWMAKNAGTTKKPALVFVSEVVEGERAGSQARDYIYTETKEGKVNKVGLGRIKAYAEAILGKEQANSPDGIDTDALLNGEYTGIMKKESYMANAGTPAAEQKTSTRLAKLLPVG